MTLVLVLLISAGLLAFVVGPAFSSRRPSWIFSAEDTPIGRLGTRREVLLVNLADLDFEFAMGKVSEEDYMSLRGSLKRQTLKIMEQMEVLGGPADAAQAPATPACAACGETAPARARFCPACGAALTA